MWVDEILYMFFLETKVQENLSSEKENIFSFQLAQIRGHLYFWQNKKFLILTPARKKFYWQFFWLSPMKTFLCNIFGVGSKIEKADGKCPSQNHLRAHFLKSVSLPKNLLQSK